MQRGLKKTKTNTNSPQSHQITHTQKPEVITIASPGSCATYLARRFKMGEKEVPEVGFQQTAFIPAQQSGVD